MVLENKTAFTVKVSEALSAQLAYDIINNRDAPLNRKSTDTIARIGIQYNF